MRGLSPRNLKYMRSFAAAYPDMRIVKQLVSQLPWGHVIRLLQRIKDPDTGRCCRVGNQNRQETPGRIQRQPAHRGGDRGGTDAERAVMKNSQHWCEKLPGAITLSSSNDAPIRWSAGSWSASNSSCAPHDFVFGALSTCVLRLTVFFDLIGIICYDAINFRFPFLTFPSSAPWREAGSLCGVIS